MRSRFVTGSSSQSILAFLCAAVALAFAGPAAVVADVAPAFKGIGIDQHLGVQVPPDLVFRNSAGKSVRLGDYFDGRRPVVLSLLYYKCPLLCPMALDQTVASLRSVNELKIGSLSDEFLLLCRQFDTTTGKYNWAVFRLLNVTGAVLILLVGGLVYVLARHHKRTAISTATSDAPPSK